METITIKAIEKSRKKRGKNNTVVVNSFFLFWRNAISANNATSEKTEKRWRLIAEINYWNSRTLTVFVVVVEINDISRE